MRLRAEIRYDADPAAVFAMLTDAAFQERKCAATGALESEVEIERFPDGGATIRTRRTMPTDQIPDFARTFAGRTLDVVQVDDLGAPEVDGRRDGNVIVEIKGAPVRFAGSLALDPSPARARSRSSTATSRPPFRSSAGGWSARWSRPFRRRSGSSSARASPGSCADHANQSDHGKP